MLAVNIDRINTPLSPTSPIETLFCQISDCCEIASVGGGSINTASYMYVYTMYDIILLHNCEVSRRNVPPLRLSVDYSTVQDR